MRNAVGWRGRMSSWRRKDPSWRLPSPFLLHDDMRPRHPTALRIQLPPSSPPHEINIPPFPLPASYSSLISLPLEFPSPMRPSVQDVTLCKDYFRRLEDKNNSLICKCEKQRLLKLFLQVVSMPTEKASDICSVTKTTTWQPCSLSLFFGRRD